MNVLVAAGALAAILIMTVHARSASTEPMRNLLPFHSFIDAKEQPEYYRETFMNVLLFIPLGLSLPFVFPGGMKHPVRLTVLSAAVLSAAIETVQYCFSLGYAETDDVIMNTLGAAIGSMAFVIAAALETRHGPCERSDT